MNTNAILIGLLTGLTVISGGTASAQEAQHMGSQVVSTEELIEALKPKPKYKTRGIRFNSQAAPSSAQAATQETTEPSIALGINFAYDSAELTSASIEQLKPLGEALNSDQLAKFHFKIDGHTDATGSENYNMGLSKRRAVAVGLHLYEKYGVKVDRLVVSGKGESQLYDPQNPSAGINRRVEIGTIVAK